MKSLVIAVVALGSLAGMAKADPPPNSNMSLAPWFRSLKQPGTGMSCCSIADCRQTDFRIQGGQYQALIEGQWRPIPPAAILRRTDNPTGRAVVCYTPYFGIMCFIRGPET